MIQTSRSEWTEEQDATLKAMAHDGKTFQQIAKVLGKSSRSAIAGRARRLGIRTKDVRKQRKEQIMQAVKAVTKQIRTPVIVEQVQEPTLYKVSFLFPKPPVKINRKGVSPLDIGANQCRYPIGEPRNRDFCFCGKPSVGSWCSTHKRVVFTRV